ncbi:MAG: hypothetical protein HFJ75_03335 [Eggerthellaceae bacterium]|nr:hypothetical protein [Eggerthellaceae bacterium]
MSSGPRDTRPESVVKRALDGLVLRHPLISAALALLLVAAVGGGAAGLGSGGISPAAGGGQAPATSATAQPGLEHATVVRVVDGDTLVVSVGGRDERVRLIGIDCPESVAPEEERNTPEGDEASAHTKGLVGAGDVVWLERDASDTDRYDRLLRYVWLEQPDDPDDPDEIATKMLNGILVRDGYARAKRYGQDTAHAEALEALGREASRAGRGVSAAWG